tara:strand:+ start:917 stop:2026 length:1110 start_codon:yes stop_codon:yes gene_type:complete
MAIPTTRIFLRSPFWVEEENIDLSYMTLELRIWNGDLTSDRPTYPNTKLRTTAVNGVCAIDIAEFARDFVEVTFGGSQDSDAVWISYIKTKVFTDGNAFDEPEEFLTGLDGYGNYQDGRNYQWYKNFLLSPDDMTAYPEVNANIPILQDHLTGWKLQTKNFNTNSYHTFHTISGLSPIEDTGSVVRYIATSSGGVFADRILASFDNAPDEAFYINYGDCNKYGVSELFFVNKGGAMQPLHFFGKYEVGLKAKSVTFDRNISDGIGNYSDTRHQKYTIDRNAEISFVMNTGWVNEEDNESFIEMMLSEQVWVKVDTTKLGKGWLPKTSPFWIVPVNIQTNDTIIKNRINDNMINYTFKFQSAYDWINTVR